MTDFNGNEYIENIVKSLKTIKSEIELPKEIAEGGDEVSCFIKTFMELIEQTKLIESISESINDVASRTNLLALNASIEAARAGEAGRGFAVVAEEVKKLSVGTKELVSSMNETLKKVYSLTDEATEKIDAMKSKVETNLKARDNLIKISDEVENITNKINELDKIIK